MPRYKALSVFWNSLFGEISGKPQSHSWIGGAAERKGGFLGNEEVLGQVHRAKGAVYETKSSEFVINNGK